MKMKIQVERIAGTGNFTECATAEGQAAEFSALTLQSQTLLHKGIYKLFLLKNFKIHTTDLLINHLLVNKRHLGDLVVLSQLKPQQ